jgi:hypothetical protein
VIRKEDGEDKGRISTLELREIRGSVVLEVLGRLALPSGVALSNLSPVNSNLWCTLTTLNAPPDHVTDLKELCGV